MTGFVLWVLWANVAMTVAVVALNGTLACRRWIVSPWVAGAVAAVAVVYLVGYVVLATGEVPVEAWSNFFRTFSLFAWPVTGMAYPVCLLAMRRHFRREIDREVTRVRRAHDTADVA